MNPAQTTDNHSRMVSRIKESQAAVSAVSDWLVRQGFKPTIPEQRISPDYESRSQFLDSGDLFIPARIEVKHTHKKHFTCRKDWPFFDMILCNTQSFDRANPKPFAYITVNPTLSHAAVVLGSTSPSWVIRPIQDSYYSGVTEPHYFCPLTCATFVRINEP